MKRGSTRSNGDVRRRMRKETINMVKLVGTGTCLLLMLALPAGAAVDPAVCGPLEKAVAAAADQFSAVKGEKTKKETSEWQATVSIPGSVECLVVGEITKAYTCTLYAGDDDDKARAVYENHVEAVGTCLGDGWTGVEKADGELTEHTFTRGKASPVVRVRSEIGRANAYTIELWVDPPTP
jgi:hypothetical protein